MIIPTPNFDLMNKYRAKEGQWSSKDNDTHGLFFIPIAPHKPQKLKVISSGFKEQPDIAQNWYHVSVSLPNRTPIWAEMAMIKDIFYGENVTVLEFHPKKSEYVNFHPFCLHLWLNLEKEIELPPKILTGF